jgi:redox-sensitive bicupin YhaK (pirin superfamily)
MNKTVKYCHPAIRDDIGDLVTRRPLPGRRVDQIDPFLFLNHHGPQTYPPLNAGLPFGPHPHRGFETVTFILQGAVAHRDSAGHESIIRAGGVQWMTSGRGLIHEEISPKDFLRDGGPLEVLQLWVNLPARLKRTAPRYIGLQRDDIPVIGSADGGHSLHLVSGQWAGRTGPVDSLTGVFMSTVTMVAGSTLSLREVGGRNVFLYIVRGALRIGDEHCPEHCLVELERQGDAVDLRAEVDSMVVLGHAEPIGEPVVAQGPFVMNTRGEIAEAIADYRAGRFRT